MFDYLPEELQIHIFSFLNLHKNQLATISQVSKKWFRLANDIELWNEILKQETQYKSQKNQHPKAVLYNIHKLNKCSGEQITQILGNFSTLSSESETYCQDKLKSEFIIGTSKLLTKLGEWDLSKIWDTLIVHYAGVYYAKEDDYKGFCLGASNPSRNEILHAILKIPKLAHKLTFDDMDRLIACAYVSPEIFLQDKIIL